MRSNESWPLPFNCFFLHCVVNVSDSHQYSIHLLKFLVTFIITLVLTVGASDVGSGDSVRSGSKSKDDDGFDIDDSDYDIYIEEVGVILFAYQ